MADLSAEERAAALFKASYTERTNMKGCPCPFQIEVAAAIREASRAAYRRGQERMQDRAAGVADDMAYIEDGDAIAPVIRSLPIEDEPTPQEPRE